MRERKGVLTVHDYSSIQDAVQSDARKVMTMISSIDENGVTIEFRAELDSVRECLGVLMSYGIVVCSACKREVHQNGSDGIWLHCEDRTVRCQGAFSDFPTSEDEIRGRWCGIDQYLNQF